MTSNSSSDSVFSDTTDTPPHKQPVPKKVRSAYLSERRVNKVLRRKLKVMEGRVRRARHRSKKRKKMRKIYARDQAREWKERERDFNRDYHIQREDLLDEIATDSSD